MSAEKNLTGMEQCTPPELREAAKNLEEIIKTGVQKKQVTGTSENVLLVYFEEQSKKKKPSTLWSVYSMLRSTISLKEDIDISKYYKLVAFIKRQNTAYKPKKSSVFSRAEITKFLLEAPDNDFLSTKAIFITGLAGACRTEELCNMHMKDITIQDDIIIVNIPHTKNATSRNFVITEPLWIKILKKYFTNRPSPDMPKAFIGFRGGKPVKQNIGHNTISNTSNKIAKFLQLEHPELHTGHSLRRSSATMLAECGGDTLSLKRLGGWKSSAVAEERLATETFVNGIREGEVKKVLKLSRYQTSSEGFIRALEVEAPYNSSRTYHKVRVAELEMEENDGKKKMKNPERQVARWPERLQQYHFEIRHRAGKLHNNGYRDKIEQRETSFYCGRTTVVEDEEWTTA
ncbi:hypothetical protein Zmor_007380 [Zophobas morio]|uniref:Tyr recombinase domain-containing protein n=1 Tax=Zophobas morio TaxID=2755281 RepID=A0AA38IZ84_9CUCU|nr:hypothetical protein Zmor_007380 [Zophobas morio]